MKSFRLSLKPDEEIPCFRRLKWELVEVPVQDVLLDGIHPWSDKQICRTLDLEFRERLNEEDSKLENLEAFGYCPDLPGLYRFPSRKRGEDFELLLESVRTEIAFAEDLDYLGLLDIAKQRLSERWNHATARSLATSVYLGFPELRSYLKSKDRSLKLSGYSDLDLYDLGKILRLEDFSGHDSLLISEALPSLNFRKASFLQRVTDSEGRLRLVPEIHHVTLTQPTCKDEDPPLEWHAVRRGSVLKFRPDIGCTRGKRLVASAFAKQWRTGGGRLCFETTLDRFVSMVEERVIVPSFPALSYPGPTVGEKATAGVRSSGLQGYHIGRFPTCNWTTAQLKEVLREYGISMTGVKGQVLDKLARLAVSLYREKCSELNRYFSKHRFVRMSARPPDTKELQILGDLPDLRNLVVSLYAAIHLRGNVILDPGHDNDTASPEDLAKALVRGKLAFGGAFLLVNTGEG